MKVRVPDSVLVLPAHELPFKGLHQRLQQVVDHHHERLEQIITICRVPSNAQALTNQLFDRNMDSLQNFLAVGEVMAHLNWLIAQGSISASLEGGCYQFCTVD